MTPSPGAAPAAHASLVRASSFAIALAGLMMVQALLGLVWPDAYRDVAWITATWFGNDLVTLAVAAPLLILSAVRARRGSAVAVLPMSGVTAYAVYNYAFYLFGAALNAYFPLYAVLVVWSAFVLLTTVRALRHNPACSPVQDAGTKRAKLVGAYFVVVAAGLASVWLWMWTAYVFLGRPTPVPPDAFRLVAALDLSAMVPLLATGGVLLWRRHAAGLVVATAAGVLASLYLLVLTVNSLIAIERGYAEPPGETLLWAPLCAATTIATLALRRCGRRTRSLSL